MGRASVFKLEGRELESRSGRAKFSSSHWGKTMFQVPYSSHILILSGVEAVQACAKKQFFGAQQIAFLQSSFSPHKAIRDDSTKRTTFQFPSHKTHNTSRINSYLRIWQSYPRVLQILKVLCAWYSWKYVARIGSEPVKFLYSAVFYNTQAAFWSIDYWREQYYPRYWRVICRKPEVIIVIIVFDDTGKPGYF